VNAPVFKDEVFVHNLKYYDEKNKVSLNGRSHIITIELTKLEKIAKKPVAEMTPLERWAVFFKYTTDKEKRELVNEIIESEEGIAMAGQVLLSISKDEHERARLTSEYKYAVDLQSKVVNARRAAEREIAQNFLRMNIPIEQIAAGTGLTADDVESLRDLE